MPSNPDSRIEFRDIEAKSKIRKLSPQLNPNSFAKAALNKVIELGKCPVCHKSFASCEYFRKLEEE